MSITDRMAGGPQPRVSVVAATRNRPELLRRLLHALNAQTIRAADFEVVVVDDGSSDETPRVLSDPRVAGDLELRTLRHAESRGPAAARNWGWRESRAELVAFTDDDCVPTPTWLEALTDAAARNPGAIVQGRTLPVPDEAEALGAFARTLEITQATPHYQTCNILYPRAVLQRLNGFDESYGSPAGEDTDLGWRARTAGVGSIFATEALVHHAVHERDPLTALKDALRATDLVKPYRDHPELRARLQSGIFLRRSHPLLAQAALGAWLARRTPLAAAFTLPYLVHLHSRCREMRAPISAVPFLATRDCLEIVATLRGAIRHRVFVV
jgi:glycosyltransferase involved in cell wall biosynthesis